MDKKLQKYLKGVERQKQRARKLNDLAKEAKLCNNAGKKLAENRLFNEAIKEHQLELQISESLNDGIAVGISHRKLGECFCKLNDYDQALIHQRKYLELAQECKNLVEEQRAHATLGRTLFMSVKSKVADAHEALNSFLESLSICGKLGDIVKEKELLEMRARLYLNIGMVYNHLKDHRNGIKFMQKALAIAKNLSLKDTEYQCHFSLGIVQLDEDNPTNALKCFEQARKAAQHQGMKYEEADTVVLMGRVLLQLGDFAAAKRILKRCHKSVNCSMVEGLRSSLIQAIKGTRLLAKLDEIKNIENEALMKTHEDLADLYANVKCYSSALSHYFEQLRICKILGKSDQDKAVIFVSIATTYADNKDYAKAKAYFELELASYSGNVERRIDTCCQIAKMCKLAGEPAETVESWYNDAMKCANEAMNAKKVQHIAQMLKSVQRKLDDVDSNNEDTTELVEDGLSSEEATQEEGDSEGDLLIKEEMALSDSNDDEEESDRSSIVKSKRGSKSVNKRNRKGETSLHVAAIKGDYFRARASIEKGVSVHARDYCGWQPLHEACNHGHVAVAELLLDHGADIDDPGGSHCGGTTPLHDAVQNGHIDIVTMLISRGVQVRKRNKAGHTPLDLVLQSIPDKDDDDEIREQLKEILQNSSAPRLSAHPAESTRDGQATGNDKEFPVSTLAKNSQLPANNQKYPLSTSTVSNVGCDWRRVESKKCLDCQENEQYVANLPHIEIPASAEPAKHDRIPTKDANSQFNTPAKNSQETSQNKEYLASAPDTDTIKRYSLHETECVENLSYASGDEDYRKSSPTVEVRVASRGMGIKGGASYNGESYLSTEYVRKCVTAENEASTPLKSRHKLDVCDMEVVEDDLEIVNVSSKTKTARKRILDEDDSDGENFSRNFTLVNQGKTKAAKISKKCCLWSDDEKLKQGGRRGSPAYELDHIRRSSNNIDIDGDSILLASRSKSLQVDASIPSQSSSKKRTTVSTSSKPSSSSIRTISKVIPDVSLYATKQVLPFSSSSKNRNCSSEENSVTLSRLTRPTKQAGLAYPFKTNRDRTIKGASRKSISARNDNTTFRTHSVIDGASFQRDNTLLSYSGGDKGGSPVSKTKNAVSRESNNSTISPSFNKVFTAASGIYSNSFPNADKNLNIFSKNSLNSDYVDPVPGSTEPDISDSEPALIPKNEYSVIATDDLLVDDLPRRSGQPKTFSNTRDMLMVSESRHLPAMCSTSNNPGSKSARPRSNLTSSREHTVSHQKRSRETRLNVVKSRLSPNDSWDDSPPEPASSSSAASPPRPPPLKIRVMVKDQTFLIPCPNVAGETKTVDWLMQEASSRYQKETGLKPKLSLFTSEGAHLYRDDLVADVLSYNELVNSTVQSWELYSLNQRYREACDVTHTEANVKIVKMFEENPHISNVDLRSMSLTHEDLLPVFRTIQLHEDLVTLVLSGNKLGDQGIKQVLSTLPWLPNLAVLELSENGITFKGLKTLVTCLKSDAKVSTAWSNLEEVDLSYNNITDVAGSDLATILCTCPNLQRLNIDFCGLGAKTVHQRSSFIAAMQGLNRLRILTVSHNNIGPLGVVCLLRVLSSLQTLDISYTSSNRDEAVINALVDYLAMPDCCIQSLSCQHCHFTDADLSKLARVMKYFTSDYELNLRNNNITNDGVSTLFECLADNPNLKYLDLSCNKEITNESLVTFLFKPSNIEILDISCCGICSPLPSNLKNSILTGNLKQLKLSLNLLTEEDIEMLSCLWTARWTQRAIM